MTVILTESIMKCRSERQNVRMDEPAAPCIPEVGRAALCSEQDSVSKSGSQGLKLETSWAYINPCSSRLPLSWFVTAGEWVRKKMAVIQGVVLHQSRDSS